VVRTFWIETLGCPKNAVDSDKLAGTLLADGLVPAVAAEAADLVVVNTCAFVEAAREESVETILALDASRRDGSRLVVTGCLAERSGDELADALPEVDAVVGFGTPVDVAFTGRRPTAPLPSFDLLSLPRPPSSAPWAYVKVAEGCDKACGFCAIPSFRGKQRSRPADELLAEVRSLHVREVVLVAQDLASYGRDLGRPGAIVPLFEAVAREVERVRLLYLYPSELSAGLIDVMLRAGMPYFDLSLQHVAPDLLRRMRRWGDGRRFLDRIAGIRAAEPEAAFRSNFIVGYPGETEDDHQLLLDWIEEAQLDWCGFFPFSREPGTLADTQDGHVPAGLVAERLSELSERQDAITAARRDALIGREIDVLVDRPGEGRSFREAPEIDGVVEVPTSLAVGDFHRVTVTGATGPDLVASAAERVAS
jgi:ribosomal protein S12 methylthiotransferase